MITKKLLYVTVEINPDMSIKKAEYIKEDVLKENDEYIVVDNHRFDTIQKKCKSKDVSIYPVLDKVSISEYSDGLMTEIFGKFCIRMYSSASEKVTENRVNREFNKWLENKLSIYGQAKKVDIKLQEVPF